MGARIESLRGYLEEKAEKLIGQPIEKMGRAVDEAWSPPDPEFDQTKKVSSGTLKQFSPEKAKQLGVTNPRIVNGRSDLE